VEFTYIASCFVEELDKKGERKKGENKKTGRSKIHKEK
jgi:hypothetical protein